jgi:hypothetical protein
MRTVARTVFADLREGITERGNRPWTGYFEDEHRIHISVGLRPKEYYEIKGTSTYIVKFLVHST